MSSSDSGSEDEQAADRQVTGSNADPQVLHYFWDLASLQQNERENAASSLVEALVSNQQQYDTQRKADMQPGGSLEQQEGTNRQQRVEQCLNCCTPVMAYGLKRLARGLASSRQGARQGFAAALAATLAHSAAAAAKQGATSLQQPFVSAAGVISVLEASLEVTGSMSGSDQRDALLGRVFGLAALVRSGLVTAYPAAGISNGSMRAVAVVATQLVGLLQRKSFLRESAAAALVELLQDLTTQQMEQVLSQAHKLSALLHTPAASASPELLFITLRLWHNTPPQQQCQLLPTLPAAACPPPQQFWLQPASVERSAVAAAASAVFSVQHVQLLVPCLLATSASHPRLHVVWGCLLALLVPGFVPVKESQQSDDQQNQQQQRRAAPDHQQLSNLWQHFVDGACFSSSHERKALALQLLQLLLPVMTPDSVPVLLSKQLLGCLATALRNKDSYLHASAKKCMDRLNTCVEHSLLARDDLALAAKLRLALAAALQAANLGPSTNSSKGGKAQLLSGMDAAAVAVYVDQLLQGFVAAAGGAGAEGRDACGPAADEHMDGDQAEAVTSSVKQLLDQLSAALRFPAADRYTLHKGLTFLTAAAFLNIPKALDTSALTAAAAAAAGSSGVSPDAAPVRSNKTRKSKGPQGETAAGPDTQQSKAVTQALVLAAGVQPQPSQQIRRHCAARLVALLHSVQHRTGQQGKQQKQQQNGVENGVQVGDSKKQKKAQQQAQQEQEAAAARAAAAQQQQALTAQLMKLVDAAQQLPGIVAMADEDIVEMVQQLQQLEAAVNQHIQQQQQQHGVAGAGSSARSRACIQLIQQLQLQLLAGGLSAEAAGSVIDDLETAVVRGLGMSTKGLGIDRSAAGLSSDDVSNSETDESIDDDEDEPAWQDVLLDLLLALLSSSSDAAADKTGGVLVPTAPLREACEAVFRAFAEDITAQGLSDMIRVLSQRASEILKPRDDEDDEMEVDESASDAGDDSDDDVASDDERLADVADQQESDSEPEEDSDEDQDTRDGALAAPAANGPQGQIAAAADAAVESDGAAADDGFGSDLDDDAMLAMDAQLGAAVRSMLARSGGGAKERAAALLGHQLRVAALMEEWTKKCSRSSLVPQISLPILQALITARGAGGHPTLADRLTSLINKHLSRCRPALPPPPAAAAAVEGDAADQQPQQQQWGLQNYEADVRKVFYYASREKDPRVAAAAAQVLLVLLTAGAEAGGAAAAAAQATAAAAFSDFFEKKKTRLQKQWFEQVMTRCPEVVVSGTAGALTALLTAASKGRNEATRSKAVLLLPALLRTSQSQQQQAVLAALQQQSALVAAALGAAVAGPYKGKEQHATAVKAVVQLLTSVQKLGDGKRLAELLGGEAVRELGKVVVVVKAAGVPPRVESQLERLVESAGLHQLVATAKPDPARLALLKKARTALEGKAGAAAGGQEEDKGQQQQGSKGTDASDKHAPQQTGTKEKKYKSKVSKAAAAAVVDKGAAGMNKQHKRKQKAEQQGGGKKRKGDDETNSKKGQKQR